LLICVRVTGLGLGPGRFLVFFAMWLLRRIRFHVALKLAWQYATLRQWQRLRNRWRDLGQSIGVQQRIAVGVTLHANTLQLIFEERYAKEDGLANSF